MKKIVYTKTLPLSFLLAIVVITALHIPYEGSMYVMWYNMEMLPFTFKDIGLLCLLWLFINGVLLFVYAIFRKLDIHGLCLKEKSEGWKKEYIVSILFLLLFWGFLFLVYMPATGFVDSRIIIRNGINMSRQHPWAYNILLWGFGRVGNKFFGDVSVGIAMYSFCQMVFSASVISGCISWLHAKGFKSWIIWCVRVFFVVSPIYGIYTISAIKDTLFGIFLVALVPLVFEMVQSKGEIFSKRLYQLAYAGCCFGLLLFRNNGLYIVLAMTLVFCLVYRNIAKMLLILTMPLAIIFSFVPSWGLKAMGKEPFFQEAVAIPLQQMVSVAVHDGEMTEEQREFIDTLLPIDQMKERYYPMNADLIKWADNFDRDFLQENKGTFLKHWFGMLVPNFWTYVEAYLMQTYTFWSPIPAIGAEIAYTETLSDEELGLRSISPLPASFVQSVKEWVSAYNKYLNPGVLFWLMMLLTLALWIGGKGIYIIVFLPLFLLWATIMISVPVAESFRYLLPFAMALPFTVGTVLLASRKDGE